MNSSIEANGTLCNKTNASDIHTKHFGHELSETFVTTISTYFILLALGGVVFNIILIYTIATTRRLHSVSNVLIVNLALCDLITAVTGIPLDTEFLLRGYYAHGLFVCGVKETAFMLSLPSSVVSLLLLTIERYFKIVHPYKHQKLFGKVKVVLLICVAWSYCILVAVFPFLYDPNATVVTDGHCWVAFPFEYAIYQAAVNFAFPMICILCMNIAIFQKAASHARQIFRQRSSLRHNDSRSPDSKKISAVQSSKPMNRKSSFGHVKIFRMNMKAAKTILALVGLFLFCWLTYIIMVIANIMCGVCHPREVTWTGNAINFTSVAVNPVLYGLLNRNIREILVKKYYQRQPHANPTSTTWFSRTDCAHNENLIRGNAGVKDCKE